MKLAKIIKHAMVLALSPLFVGAASADNFAPPSSLPTNGVVYKLPGNAIPTDQTLNLNNQAFGFNGPISFNVEYSRYFGYVYNTKYTQALGANNATSLELDLGSNQRRYGATFGHRFLPNHLGKITIERLAQNIGFNFDSGSINRWVAQDAIGAAYEYLLPDDKMFKDFNVSTYLAKSQSHNLESVRFTNADGTFINYRHIAGATSKGLTAGVDLQPWSTGLVGLGLNFDQIHYDQKYTLEDTARNRSGLGFTVSLQQLITDHVKFNLLTSQRAVNNTYQAGVSWLVPTSSDNRLELGVTASRLISKDSTPSDTQVALKISYSWGGKPGKATAGYNILAPLGKDDLSDWVATPAVHMDQVFAAVDQKTEKVADPVVNSNTDDLMSAEAAGPSINPNFPTSYTIQPGQAYDWGTKPMVNIPGTPASAGLFITPASYSYITIPNLNEVNAGLQPCGLVATSNPGNPRESYTSTMNITGTAAAAGTTCTVNIIGHNTLGDSPPLAITFIILGGKPTMTLPATLPAAQAMKEYSLDLTPYINNGGDSGVTVAAKTIPGWLKVTNTNGKWELGGTPSAQDVSTKQVQLTVSNRYGSNDSNTANITVKSLAPTPTVPGPADLHGRVNVAITNFSMAPYFTPSSPKGYKILDGALPAGIQFTNGEFSGTPQPGTGGHSFPLHIAATNETNPQPEDWSGPQSITLIIAKVVPTVTQPALQTGHELEPVAPFSVASSFSPNPSQYKIDGTLPAWLHFNTTSGQFTANGTPNIGDAKTYSIDVRATLDATDPDGWSAPATVQYTIKVAKPKPSVPGPADQNVREGVTMTPFSIGSYFEHNSAKQYKETGALPDGMQFNATTGEFSGTPKVGSMGSYPIQVIATNETTPAADDWSDVQSVTFKVATRVPTPPTIIKQPDPQTGRELEAIDFSVASYFSPAVQYHIVSSTPAAPWLHIDDKTGKLTGTPQLKDANTYTIIVKATNIPDSPNDPEWSLPLTVTYLIKVAKPVPTVPGPGEQPGRENVALSFSMASYFNPQAKHYKITTGTLPTGVTFNTDTGLFSGTPAVGSHNKYPIQVVATSEAIPGDNDWGNAQDITFNILQGLPPVPTITQQPGPQTGRELELSELDSKNFFTPAAQYKIESSTPAAPWLQIDATTGKLSGTPQLHDANRYSVIVKATNIPNSTDENDWSKPLAVAYTIKVVKPTPPTALDKKAKEGEAAPTVDMKTLFGPVGAPPLTKCQVATGGTLPGWLKLDAANCQLQANGNLPGDLAGKPVAVNIQATNQATPDASDWSNPLTINYTFDKADAPAAGADVERVVVAGGDVPNDVVMPFTSEVDLQDCRPAPGSTVPWGLEVKMVNKQCKVTGTKVPDGTAEGSYTFQVQATNQKAPSGDADWSKPQKVTFTVSNLPKDLKCPTVAQAQDARGRAKNNIMVGSHKFILEDPKDEGNAFVSSNNSALLFTADPQTPNALVCVYNDEATLRIVSYRTNHPSLIDKNHPYFVRTGNNQRCSMYGQTDMCAVAFKPS